LKPWHCATACLKGARDRARPTMNSSGAMNARLQGLLFYFRTCLPALWGRTHDAHEKVLLALQD
ncbi:MAG: hypothetical protein M3329_06190, partial [Pseudomonadota bacterium]|nr:hypothetical protein [Pseudomonadota bacterium]